MDLGQIGIWRRRMEGSDDLDELEALGYTAFWVGSSPSPADARGFLERSSTLTVATGILNVWQHEPADVAAQHAELTRDFPDRFLLGIGVGHPEATAEYTAPLATMTAFFDGWTRPRSRCRGTSGSPRRWGRRCSHSPPSARWVPTPTS